MTHPTDIAGLSERLREMPSSLNDACRKMDEAATALDSLSARVKELEVENERLRTAIKVDREVDAQSRDEDRRRLNELRRRAEQQRDEAYERAAKVAETPDIWKKFDGDFEGNCIAAAIRHLASCPEGGSEGRGEVEQ